jgi:hypothetical protein
MGKQDTIILKNNLIIMNYLNNISLNNILFALFFVLFLSMCKEGNHVKIPSFSHQNIPLEIVNAGDWDSLINTVSNTYVEGKMEIYLYQVTENIYDIKLLTIGKLDSGIFWKNSISWSQISLSSESKIKCELTKLHPVNADTLCIFNMGFSNVSISIEEYEKLKSKLLSYEDWSDEESKKSPDAGLWIKFEGKFLSRTDKIDHELSDFVHIAQEVGSLK